jgi:hypothetical protein
MSATYIKDHRVRPLEEWTGKQSHDWLHPDHGPLPTKIGAVLYGQDEYMVCLWLRAERIVTVTELVDVVNVNKGWGNRSEKKGWIMNSLNWRPTKDGFMCEDQRVMVPEVLKHREDRDKEDEMLQEIMTKSVEITVRTPLGCPVTYLHNSVKG